MSEIPTELSDRFEIHEPLPKSDTGDRYRVTEKSSGRNGVLELVRPEAIGSASDRQRLKRELSKQATLRHSNLALPWVTGEIEKTLWLFREWVDGKTLRDRLDSDGALAVSEALAVTTQIAAGLDELHRAGLLFRDLKPNHIMLRPDGSAVLVAAGLAARVEHEDVFDLYGTPNYLSPEQCKGKLVSFRSDLYALGCILHEMATGRPPFATVGNDPAQLIEAHKQHDPPDAPESLPEEARSLLNRLLSKDPRQRPFSAQQVRRTLDPLLPEDLKSGEIALDDHAPKKTLLGMPAVSSAPPKPPSMSRPPRPPSMNPPKPKPAPKKNPDATQQLGAVDILDEKPLAKSVPPPAPTSVPPPAPTPSVPPQGSVPPPPPAEARASNPPRKTSVPPPPPGAEPAKKSADATQQLDAVDILDEQPAAEASEAAESPDGLPPFEEFTAAAEAALLQTPETEPNEGAGVEGLDYEDDAPTIARDTSAMAEPAQSTTPTDPGLGAAVDPSIPPPAANPQAHSTSAPPAAATPSQHPVSVPAPAVADNRNGLYMLGAAALVFLSVAMFIGWQVIRSSEEPEPVAQAPTTVAAPAPTVAPEPTPAPAPTVMEATPVPEPAVAEPVEVEEPVEEPAEEPTEEVAEEPAEEPTEEPEVEVASAMTSMSTMRRRRNTMRRQSNFDALREQARTHYQARRYREAAQAYQRATAANPRHAGSWAGLGAARMSLRDYRGAAQAYQRAVQINPRSSGFFTSLGHAYRMGNNRNGARQAYQRALALNPNNTSAQQWLQRL
ncbi:MAG: protein kinase [Myxococcota bacterium]